LKAKISTKGDDTDIVLYGRDGTTEYVVEVKTGRGFNPADMGLCLRDLFRKGGVDDEVAN
jgi:hypothetical protein